MTHSPTCTGCPTCDPEMRFLLSMNLSDIKDCERYSKWLTERDRKRGIRTASAGDLRCGITYVTTEEDTVKNDYRAPDIYAAPLAKIRAAEATLSEEQLRAFERELARRVGADVRIVSTNANLGTGTYEASTGGLKPFTFSGNTITTPVYAHAKPVNAGGPLKDKEIIETDTPDPYVKDLAAMRAAEATPLSRFEDAYKAERLTALAAERATLRTAQAPKAPSMRVLTAAKLKQFAPPNPYASLKEIR